MQVWYIPAGHGRGTICLTLCRDNQHTSPPDVPTNRLEPKVKTSDKGFYKDLMYSRWSSKKDPLIRSHPYEPDRFYLHHHCDAFSTLDEFQQLLRLAQTRGRSRRFQSLKKRWMQIRYIFGMPRKAYSWQDMTGHDRTWQDMTGHDRCDQSAQSAQPNCSNASFQSQLVSARHERFSGKQCHPLRHRSCRLGARLCQMSAQVNWKFLHFHPQCRDLWDYRLGLSIELLETSLILSSGQHATSGESWTSVALALRSPSRKQVGCDTGIAATCFRTL